MSFKKTVLYPADREDSIDSEIKEVLLSSRPPDEKLRAYKKILGDTLEQKIEKLITEPPIKIEKLITDSPKRKIEKTKKPRKPTTNKPLAFKWTKF